ncbi:carboxylic ester hydrolase-like [Onthophagus taurus]|uniref:carboxylic ester hydrolase-like n=1 Tax=Onthophagus taurus TaxID=166361 RepID=UPI0039BE2F58
MLTTHFVAISFYFCVLLQDGNSLRFVDEKNQRPELQLILNDGIVQGKKMFTEQLGEPYYGYLGIPYAKPPVGNLRFSNPVQNEKWSGVLQATHEGNTCTQDTEIIFHIGSEDCLYVNVFTKQSPSVAIKSLQPVTVFIYGGGWKFGQSNQTVYGPDYLLEQDVIVVTFNYRVGVFGFLSTDDMSSPGNYGLKDQIEVLKWIRRNIRNFGGDPNSVTIFGESAGAASVSYLMLAPKAKGLFHRAISFSGSSLCPWALSRNPLQITYAVATAAGVIEPRTKNLVKRLRKLDYDFLHFAERSAMLLDSINPMNGLSFAPTIEPDHPDAVLSRGPLEMLKEASLGSVPFITGFNSLEGAVFQYILDFLRPLFLSYEMPQRLIPSDLNIPTFHPDEITVGNKIKNFYFGLDPLAVANKTQILHFISDNQFLKGIIEEAKLRGKKAPTYLYQFSYQGDLGHFLDNQLRQVNGVAHSEELWYVFKNEDQRASHKNDIAVRKMFVKILSNFVKTGNPTPIKDLELQNLVWPEMLAGNGDLNFLDIDKKLSVKQNPRKSAMEFWNEIYKDYGRRPYTTY